MVFDAIVDEGRLELVERLTARREVELLAALATMQELERVPDRQRRRTLQRVRVLVVAPPDEADPAVRRLGDRLRASPAISDEDAAIALTAAAHGAPLVTEDRDLRRAAAEHLPELALWTWLTDLEPRLRHLGGGGEGAAEW